MLAVLQTALQPETPHIGEQVPFVAIFVGVIIVAICLGLAIDYLSELRRPSLGGDREVDELLASQQLGVARTEEAHAKVQERSRALGITPPR
jgi:hypothetical protein